MSNTPSQLREILAKLLATEVETDANEIQYLDQAEQAILTLFMECLPEKKNNVIYSLEWTTDEEEGFNQAIDITAQHMQALGSSDD